MEEDDSDVERPYIFEESDYPTDSEEEEPEPEYEQYEEGDAEDMGLQEELRIFQNSLFRVYSLMGIDPLYTPWIPYLTGPHHIPRISRAIRATRLASARVSLWDPGYVRFEQLFVFLWNLRRALGG